MKRIALLSVCIICTVILSGAGIVLAGTIVGSKHDFSGQAWSGGEICKICHTPHDADMTVTGAPLWNHKLSTATYTLYSSPTMDGAVGQPGTYSKLCLACHDGTVAIDSFGGATGVNYISGKAKLGTNLSDDHPVGLFWNAYPHQTLPSSGADCNKCHNVGYGSVGQKMILPFFSHRVECASCHEPHNNVSNPKLLRKPLAKSEICLHCHQDK